MVGSSKILTVKYGTFSCTAEGFDDPLAAVKSTTQYFRNVAREDHFFGSEPPAFDPALAEELLRRRIASDLRNDHLTVRPAPADVRQAPLTDESRRPDDEHPLPAAMPDTDAADVTTHAGVSDTDSEADCGPDASEDHSEPVWTPAPREARHGIADTGPAEAPEEEPIAAKLARIRAVVGGPASVDPVAVEPAAPADAPHEDVTDEKGTAYDTDIAAQAADTPYEDDAFPEDSAPPPEPEIADADDPDPMQMDAATPENTASAFAGSPQTGASQATTDMAGSDSDADDLEAMLAGIRAQASQDQPEALSDDPSDPSYDALAVDETSPTGAPPERDDGHGDAYAAFSEAGHAKEQGQDLATDAWPETPSVEDPQMDAAPDEGDSFDLTRQDASGLDAYSNGGTTEADDTVASYADLTAIDDDDPSKSDALQDAAPAAPDQEPFEPTRDEAPSPGGRLRARVLAVKRAALENTPPISYDDEGDDPSAEADERAGPVLGERSDRLGAASTLSADEEAELSSELAAVRAELDGVSPEPSAPLAPLRLDNPLFEADADADDTPEPGFIARASAGARKAVRMASPARALLTERSVEDGDTSRLIEQANSELDEPEGNRRRSAIAHLRAAVAATRADRALRADDGTSPSDPYREDLAQVVRPRRPRPQGGARTARPAPDQGTAPLQLVADQRVAEISEPVRPRRVNTAAELPPRPERADEDAGGGYEDYAETVGARSLPDLLEAAAAYMAFVEGHEQFSRPQLMAVLEKVEAGRTSREERLRSFGRLLRDGKIEKTRGGRFTASDSIGFRPDARQAG